MTDQKAPEGPQERPEGGSAGLASSEPLTGAQAGADSLGLREVIAGAIWDANSTHPDAIADAVYTRLKPHLAPHYQRAVDAATAAEQRAQQAEADRKTLGQSALDYQQRAWDEAVGPDWIVARNPHNEFGAGLYFAAGRSELRLCIQARDEPCPEDPCPFGKYEQPLTDITSNRHTA
ncbi:hypothetical protein [Streptomyces albogriseolus]|uniref:hypothetical protein n=1 Tax=Streptomyces albogriseolus TaxID=1887 RepID=UPI00345FF0C8